MGALRVPSLALLIDNFINWELFHTYCKLKDPRITIELIIPDGSQPPQILLQEGLPYDQGRASKITAYSNPI